MSMIRDRLFRNTIGRLPCKDVGDGRGSVFFNRYSVLKTRWFSVYLHQFFRSDGERCLHDHPWAFTSIILRGGYWEEMFPPWMTTQTRYSEKIRDDLLPEASRAGMIDRHWRRPGSILWRTAKTSHRIVMEPGTRPWSLVIVGRKVRDWGFWTPAGWWKWRPGGTPICEADEGVKHA